jgi:tetratricopeptide (TPR) repeat protein
MNGLARCLKDEGQVDKAIEVWEKSYQKYPGPNAAAAGLAATYSERKQYDKAVKFYEELVKAQPDNAEFKSGLEEARRVLRRSESF